MHVLIVSQYYKPEGIYIPDTLADGLAARGHDVTVVTAYPNYPDGKIFKGYRQQICSSETDGKVRILRVPLWISHSNSAVGRFANYISYALSAFLRMLLLKRIDVIYVYATQMTPAIGPSLMRLLRGTPYVMHIQDLWPESVTGSSMLRVGRISHLVAALLTPWLRGLYGQASATIAIAPTMAQMLVERGVPKTRIRTVLNWANEGALPGAETQGDISEGPVRDQVRIVFAGNLGDHQDLETVIEAASINSQETNVQLHFYGSGVAEERLRGLARELEVSNVTFHGRVAIEEMADVYAVSDFQLVTLRDREIFRGTIPSKLQASLARGRPVLTNVAGDVSQLCNDEGFGLSCAPASSQDMARMLRRASLLTTEEREVMAKKGQDFYRCHMSYRHGVESVEQILEEARAPRRET